MSAPRVSAAFAAVALIATTGSANAPNAALPQQPVRDSTNFVRDGVVVKEVVRGGVTISVSIRDRSDAFVVDVEIHNAAQSALSLSPDQFQLDVRRPRPRSLSLIPPDVLSATVIRRANNKAAGVEGLGLVATTTVHESVPVVETVFNPASVNDPTQPSMITRVTTETVVKVVPDEAARMRALGDAAAIRQNGRADAKGIVSTALAPGQVAVHARVRGRVYFERDADARDAVLRIPLGSTTVDVPFTAVKRRPFPWKPVVFFE